MFFLFVGDLEMLRSGSEMARLWLLWLITSITAEMSMAKLKIDTYPADTVPDGNIVRQLFVVWNIDT